MAPDAEEFRSLKRLLARRERLVQAAYALHSTLDLDELLNLILGAAADGVEAERGTVYLLGEDGTSLWSRVLSGEEELEITLPVGQGIAGSVAATGETVRIADAYADPRFDRSWDEKSGYKTRQILCAPIRNREGGIVGVFQLLNKKTGGFTVEDEEYLAALSVHAALAVENARLHASALEKERYDREVALARSVQRALQPERRTAQEGVVAAAGLNEICEDATGDYYDLIAGLPGDRLGVVVGDVSGHGLQAALVMSAVRAFLRAFVHSTPDLPKALDLLNDFLVPDLSAGRFVSLFAALVDTRTGEVEWCNAGHNPPLVRRAGSGEVVPLPATGRVLGVFPNAAYRAGAPLTLAPGDLLLLYTDGVTEARNAAEEQFGEERLSTVLAGADGNGGPEAILGRVREAVSEWTGHGPNEDDLTLLAATRLR